MKTFVTAAASIAMIAATLTATTASQADTRKARATNVMSLKVGGGSSASPIDNTAHAWTSACYAEFGPNAKYPDAALLEKCLNF